MSENNEAVLPWRVLAKKFQYADIQPTGKLWVNKVQECDKTFGSTSCRKQWQNGVFCPGCSKQK